MKYLIDSREPITVEDIDRAMNDADVYLAKHDDVADHLIKRLSAIVENAYGYEPGRDRD